MAVVTAIEEEEEMREIIITPESGSEMDSGLLGAQKAPSSQTGAASPVSNLPSGSQGRRDELSGLGNAAQSAAVLGLMSQLSSGQWSSLFSSALEVISAKTGKEKLTLVGWKEMFDTDRIRFLGPYTTRLPKKVKKFMLNYIIITLILTIYAILTTPGLLFTIIILSVLGLYVLQLRSEPIVVAGRELTSPQKALIFISFSFLVVFLTTPASSSFLWVVLVAAATIFIHAMVYQADEERPDQFFAAIL